MVSKSSCFAYTVVRTCSAQEKKRDILKWGQTTSKDRKKVFSIPLSSNNGEREPLFSSLLAAERRIFKQCHWTGQPETLDRMTLNLSCRVTVCQIQTWCGTRPKKTTVIINISSSISPEFLTKYSLGMFCARQTLPHSFNPNSNSNFNPKLQSFPKLQSKF